MLYLAHLDPARGTEASKLRPVLVIQTDLLNEVAHSSTWVLPCTTRLSGENSDSRSGDVARLAAI